MDAIAGLAFKAAMYIADLFSNFAPALHWGARCFRSVRKCYWSLALSLECYLEAQKSRQKEMARR